jgi:hypothetical protein
LHRTICQSRNGAVSNISSVPLPRSSAKSRIVSSGGMNKNTSQNQLLLTIGCMGK